MVSDSSVRTAARCVHRGWKFGGVRRLPAAQVTVAAAPVGTGRLSRLKVADSGRGRTPSPLTGADRRLLRCSDSDTSPCFGVISYVTPTALALCSFSYLKGFISVFYEQPMHMVKE